MVDHDERGRGGGTWRVGILIEASADSWEIPVEVEVGDAGMDEGSETNDQRPDDD